MAEKKQPAAAEPVDTVSPSKSGTKKAVSTATVATGTGPTSTGPSFPASIPD